MSISQDTLAFLLMASSGFLFLVIFAAIYYLWKKTEDLERRAKGKAPRQESVGEPLLGLRGKEIWDFLMGNAADIERQKELRKRFVFVLQRHVEGIIEQGLYDARKGKVNPPQSEANVGGTKGEIASWVPPNYVNEFYVLGQSLKEERDPADKLHDLEINLRAAISKIALELKLEVSSDALTQRIIGNVNSALNEQTRA